jgi:SAM-dependent methyltransferase
MNAPPLIFDRRLSRQRRQRALKGLAAHDFLFRNAAEEMQERLGALLPVPVADAFVVSFVDLPDMARLAVQTVRRTPLDLDEESIPLATQALDLYISNLTLHTVNDLPGALIQTRQALRPGGRFMAALFGPRTLQELRAAFTEAELEIQGGVSPRVHPFVDVRDAGALLRRAGFEEPVADTFDLSVVYRTPMRLLHELRGMGETNVLVERRRVPLRRATLARAIEIYTERFTTDGGLRATFEMLFMSGRARGG